MKLAISLLLCLTLALLAVHTVHAKGCGNAKEMRLVLKPGETDYGNCVGTYVRSMGNLHKKIMWINKPKSRFMFYSGKQWTITAGHYYTQVFHGAKGGYYFAEPGDEDRPTKADWGSRYTIEC